MATLLFLGAASALPAESLSLASVCRFDQALLAEVRQKNSLSFHDFFVLAAAASDDLAMQVSQGDRAGALYRQSLAGWLPQLSLRASALWAGKTAPVGPGGLTGTRLNLHQNIFHGLNEYSELRSAGENRRLQQALLRDLAGQVYLSSASLFYEIVKEEALLESRRQILAFASDNVAQLQNDLNLGKISPAIWLRARAGVARLEALLTRSENQVFFLRQSLARFSLGSPAIALDDSLELQTPAGPPPILPERADLLAARLELSRAELRLLAAKGGHLPSLYFDGSYRLPGPASPGDVYAQLTAELPIFKGGETLARVEEMKAARQLAWLQLQKLQKQAEAEISQVWQKLQGAQSVLAASQQALELARQSYEQSLLDFHYRKIDSSDLLAVLSELETARSDYISARHDFRMSRLQWGVVSAELPFHWPEQSVKAGQLP